MSLRKSPILTTVQGMPVVFRQIPQRILQLALIHHFYLVYLAETAKKRIFPFQPQILFRLRLTSASSVVIYSGMFEMGRTVMDILHDMDILVDNAYSVNTAKDFRCFLGSSTGADTVAPVITGSVSATGSTTSVLLAWTAASDNVSLAANLQYKVVRAATTASIDTVAAAEVATVATNWTANITQSTVLSPSDATLASDARLMYFNGTSWNTLSSNIFWWRSHVPTDEVQFGDR